MKTRLLLTFALLTTQLSLLTSQIPQGFNYQAIARDPTGAVIANQPLPVRITIQTSSTGGIVIWEEQHSSVTSNQFGLISMVIGQGSRIGGTAPVFSGINWNAQTLYLKTSIQYPGPGWTVMGTTQLWSVPYSLVAKDVEGPVAKLGITGETDNMEEALFEVKNSRGQTVFAVYSEGVRIYVEDGDAKGAKGGFAVGGFGLEKSESQNYLFVSGDSIRAYIYDDPATKGAKGGFAVGGFNLLKNRTNDYMLVSPDSIRMYIDDTEGKGAKGGFAVGGFNMTKAESEHYLDITTDAGGIIDPSENRVLWYPLKNAFLVGRVLIISPEHVGENSFVSGFESRASGSYSQAMGFKTMATGNYSTAIGVNAASTNTNSFAFGDSPVASGADSYAFGAGAIASGRGSYALGSFGRDASGNLTPIKTTASGDYSFALGLGSVASGLGAFTFGASDTAAGWFSTVTGIWNKVEPGGVCAMANGIGTKAGNYAAAAFGDHTYASGHTSFATGYKTTAAGQWSATLGGETIANGVGSIAAGYGSMVESTGYGGIATGYLTKAGNWVAAAFGDQTYASGHTSFATGFKTTALGHTSSTFGESTTANGYASVAFGRGTVAQTFGSMAIGNYNAIIGPDEPNAPWNFWEPVLSIGNGTSPEERSNAMTVYNSGIADFQGFINLSTNSYFSEAIRVRDAQALWYNGTYFSWGYGGNYNVFADHVSVGTTASPGTYALYVAGNAMTTGTWGTSDIRWKKNLVPLKNVLRDINKLEPVSYNWRTDEFPDMDFDEGNQIGLVAQDVEKIFPDLVKSDANGFKAVAYDKLSVVLLQAIREQQQHIKSQDDKIARLEALVNRLMTE